MPSQKDRPQCDERGDGVAADGHEAGLAEVEQSGVAEVHVQADRRQAVDRSDRSQALLQAWLRMACQSMSVSP